VRSGGAWFEKRTGVFSVTCTVDVVSSCGSYPGSGVSDMKMRIVVAVMALFSVQHAWRGAAVEWCTGGLGGEAAALNVLKDDMQKRGYAWKDSPSPAAAASRRDGAAREVAAGTRRRPCRCWGHHPRLRRRGLSATSPASPTRRLDKWCGPYWPSFSKNAKGQWVASPVNIHRTNWIWRTEDLRRAEDLPAQDLRRAPRRLGEIKAAGYIPLAHGGQPCGSHHLRQRRDVGRRAGLLQEGDDRARLAALGSKTMEKAFDQMAKLRTLVDDNFSGRD